MERRAVLMAVVAGVAGTPLRLFAQPKVARIGFFYFGSRRSAMESGRYAVFVDAMRRLGYVEGRNLVIEARFADGKGERLAELADELLRLKVDVIVATGTPVYATLKRATTTVPVVITVSPDPVVDGIAASLAHPGANFTGLSTGNLELYPKYIELMKLAVPKLSRIALMWNSENTAHPAGMKAMRSTTKRAGLSPIEVNAPTPEEIERGFASMARQRADAVVILNDTFFIQQFDQIASLALKYRLASLYGGLEYAEAGGFMGYGQKVIDNFGSAAIYVDKILKGARPGDLPIEQPMRVELAINRRTAKAIGLTIPPELLLRADKVIE
jgi:putative ABC transport system substrate-binding protein